MSTTPYLPRIPLVLASKSPARLTTLRNAGIAPHVHVSQVDESALLSNIRATPSGMVLALAAAKAREVAERIDIDALTTSNGQDNNEEYSIPPLILGCDSMLEIDGEIWGKPHTAERARERLKAMSGKSGILHTGHCLTNSASFASLSAVSHATVHICPMSEADINAYVATGEPLHVAGSFTVDGVGGPFIDAIDGDYHGVVGLSLPLLRSITEKCGLSITQLWAEHNPARGYLSDTGKNFLDPNARVPRRSADGFLLCSCGSRHWGLNGAGGICALRMHEGHVQVLLQLRSPWSHSGGTWSIPGGAVEWHESAYSGAVREFCEETGIDPSCITPCQPQTITLTHGSDSEMSSLSVEALAASHPDLYVDTEVAPHLLVDHGEWTYSSFLVTCPDTVVIQSNDESIQLEWFDIDSPLPSPLHPAFASAWPVLLAAARQVFSS